jgi:hypothetical protein
MAKMNDVWKIVSVVGVLLIASFAVGAYFFSVTSPQSGGSTGGTGAITADAKAQFCANNPSLDAKIRVKDGLSDTLQYLNATVIIQNLDTGSIVEKQVNSASGDFVTLSSVYDCNSVKGYKLYVKGTDPTNSDGVVTILPADLTTTPVETTLTASKFGNFKMKVYDNINRANVQELYTNSTDYTSNVTAKFGYFNGNPATSLDLSLTLRPDVAGTAFGKMMYIAIDSEDSTHLSDWDESQTVVMYNGVVLKQATNLPENDLRAMNSYETIYAVPSSIGMDASGAKQTEANLEIKMYPESSALTNSYPVTVKFIARGDAQSTKSNTVLTGVGFSDDSSRTPLYTAQTAEFVLN